MDTNTNTAVLRITENTAKIENWLEDLYRELRQYKETRRVGARIKSLLMPKKCIASDFEIARDQLEDFDPKGLHHTEVSKVWWGVRRGGARHPFGRDDQDPRTITLSRHTDLLRLCVEIEVTASLVHELSQQHLPERHPVHNLMQRVQNLLAAVTRAVNEAFRGTNEHSLVIQR